MQCSQSRQAGQVVLLCSCAFLFWALGKASRTKANAAYLRNGVLVGKVEGL
jgi:hypothetical protein